MIRHLFAILLATLPVMTACTHEDSPEPQPTPTTDLEKFETISSDVKNLLEQNPDISYEEIKTELAKYASDLESVVVEDDFLYVTTKGGYEIQVDKYGKSLFQESDEEEEPVDMDALIAQLDDSLGIGQDDDDNDNTANATSPSGNPTPASRASSEGRTLHAKKILLWNPWKLCVPDFRRAMTVISKAFNLKYVELLGDNCTPSSVGTFNQYDIVVLVCHGIPRGQLVLPYNEDWQKVIGLHSSGTILIPNPHPETVLGDYIEAVVTNTDLSTLLPDLSKTILFTGVCHVWSQNSAFLNSALRANVAEFIGATNVVNNVFVLPHLYEFARYFYKGATAADAFYPHSPRKLYYDYTLETGEKGKYCRTVFQDVRYEFPYCAKPNNNLLRGYRTVPYGTNPAASPRKVTRDAASNMDTGFWIQNKDTGNVITVPYNSSQCTCYNSQSYQDLITSYLYSFDTSNLEEGKYVYRTYAVIDGVTIYSDNMYEFTVVSEGDWVDLGLPSGTIWATRNIGASKPEDYGDYFAWGETKPKSVYDPSTYQWFKYDEQKGRYLYTKYCTSSSFGAVDNRTELELSDDAAYVNWGSGCRMPSMEQIIELIDKCNWTWTSLNGVVGQLGKSKYNKKTIFLPAAGGRYGSSLSGAGSYGDCWSRTLDTDGSFFAYGLYFRSLSANRSTNPRYNGQSVRAVRVSQN